MIRRPITGSAARMPSQTNTAVATTLRETSRRPGRGAVGDQRGARQAPAAVEPDLSGDLVADEADHAGSCQHPEMIERVRVQKPIDRDGEREARRHEDRQHDKEAGDLLPRALRRKNAIPSGTAVSASPKLCTRSARSATEPDAT